MLIGIDLVAQPNGAMDANVSLNQLAMNGRALGETERAFLLARDVNLAGFVAERVWRFSNRMEALDRSRFAFAG